MCNLIGYLNLSSILNCRSILLILFLTYQSFSQTNSRSTSFFGITNQLDNKPELIEINQYTGMGGLIEEIDSLKSLSLAINSDGEFVYADTDSILIYTIDSLSGDIIFKYRPDLPSLACIAFSNRDILYAFDKDGNLYQLDLNRDTSHKVIEVGETFSGMSFHPATGELYACTDSNSFEEDAIIKIDTLTGFANLIGYTNLEGYNRDIAFDQTGRLYGIKKTLENPDFLFEIDLESGEGFQIGDSIGFRGITSIAAQFLKVEEEQPQILVDPPFIEYGDVIMDTYIDQTIRIFNVGDVNLNISQVEIKGISADDFSIIAGGGTFYIYRGYYRDIIVRYSPTIADSSKAYIQITSDDPDEGIVSVPISGNCIEPKIPDIEVEPDAHDFGDVVIGTVKGMTFEIINEGNADLQIVNMSIGGPSYSEFFFSPIKPSLNDLNPQYPFTIAPGDTHSFDVIVMPKTKGDKNAILTIRSNDPDEDPTDIPLQAVALGIPDIIVSPNPFYFGNVSPGSYKDQGFTIYNKGEEDLIISSTTLTGFHANEFSITSGGAPITILPGRTASIYVRFEPQTINEKYADLVLYSNDPDENPYIVPLSGNRGPEPPILHVVQPYYDPSVSMYVECMVVMGGEEYQFRRKIDNGPYGDWISSGNANFYLDNAIAVGPEYTYQARVKIGDEFSDTSRHRSSKAIKVWPGKRTSSITSPDSREILNGFNTALSAWFGPGDVRKYLHEGLDIQGHQTINDECIVAPLGGIVTAIKPNTSGSNIWVDIEIRIDNSVRQIRFNHLKAFSINPDLIVDWSIAPGEKIGEIGSGFFGDDMNNHTHFHYWDIDVMADARNPLLLFDRNENMDPYLQAPVVENTNNDGQAIRFKIGPNTNNYFPSDTIIYLGADIVAEITDHQSMDVPWVTPQKVGYYIKQIVDGMENDIVRNSTEPYILLDGHNWYGNSTLRPPILFDLDNAVQASNAFRPSAWPLWYTYIVTNTSSTNGALADLDANQCWATNAINTEVAPNGYRNWYSLANSIEEAKFPDRFYSVYIRSADFVNNPPDVSHKVLVDNFKPYVTDCNVLSEGSLIYSAQWDWDGSRLSLNPNDPKDGISGSAKVDKDITIIISTSEPMKELYIEDIKPLGCGRIEADPSNIFSDRTEWIFIVNEGLIPDDGSKNGKQLIHIRGEDFANNKLQGYNEAKTSYASGEIPKRTVSGNWTPLVVPGADRMHRFIIGMVDVAFVIDDTGSMGEEIAGVRQALLDHLATFEDDGKTTFLLVTFKDGVTVGEPTSELSVIQSQVSALGASGGGDCPEGSVEALNAVVDLMNEDGNVFLATDAAPHPGVDNSATMSALASKGVRVSVILSGDCADLEKILSQIEGTPENSISNENLKKEIITDKSYLAEILSDTLNLKDDDFRGLELPFSFPFSDQEYDSIFVGSNGYITLGSGISTNYAYVNTILSGPPILAGYFTDLSPQDGGEIRYGQVGDDFYVLFDTVYHGWYNEKVTFSIILRPDGTFAFDYGDLERKSALVGFSIGSNVLDPGEIDLSEAEQPIIALDYGSVYEVFYNDADLSNIKLEFDRVTYVKPPVLNAVSAFSLMAKETGGVFAYVPEVNGNASEDKVRFENIIFNLVQGAITQSLVFVEPKKVPRGSNLTISITGSGTNFQNTTMLQFSGSGITVNRINAISAIRLEADIHIDEGTELGFKDLTAITSLGGGVIDTARGKGSLEVIEQPYYPSVVGVTPSSGRPGQTLTVLIYGIKTNFTDSSEVEIGSGINVNSVKAITSTLLQAEISIASNAEVGFRDITVNSGYERAKESLTGPFFVSMTSFEKAELISVDPSYAAPGTSVTLNIKGNNTHFKSGSSVVTFSGTGIKLMNIEVIDTLQLNAFIEIAGDADPGFRDVRVSTETESAVFLSGLLITTNKPVVKVTSALFQNPAATKYCDIIVVAEELLESIPDVQVYTASDTTDINMSLMEGTDDVYQGSYVFSHSGEHWISAEIHTVSGIDSVHARNIEVLLTKKGSDNSIITPSSDALLQISKDCIDKEICFVADEEIIEDSKIYHFSPDIEFSSDFLLEINIDKEKFPDYEKLFIYRSIDNRWERLPSRVYPIDNVIKADISDLGQFKVMIDSTFSGNNIVPSAYALMQCYPNPFNPSTTIEFNLPEDNFIDLSIYNTLGQKIRTLTSGEKSAGRYKIVWNADGIASGIYFYRLRTMRASGQNGKNFTQTKKMILLR